MESRNSFVDIELNEREMVEQPTEHQPNPSPDAQRNFFTKFLHSFGPREGPKQSSGDSVPVEGDTSPLKRSLKGRHLQFIAIGGSIGAGLFIGCGKALATGGPAWLLIAFSIVGIMLLSVMHALGELAAIYPISGSFAVFSSRFIDKSWGFAMGWNYAMQWLVALPFELTAAGLTLAFWNTGTHMAIWITIFWVCITLINMSGVRGYGECEMIFATLKILAVVMFVITGIVIDCGGGPSGEVIGFKYWKDPGSFNNGFKGFCSVLITAAFSLAGTELVGLAAAETDNPRETIPRAAKQVFWRLILFYFSSLFVVACVVPFTHPQLLASEHSADLRASPFVIAIQDAGIKGLPHVINAVILISVLSVGNSSTYASTRTLHGLADNGQAPKILKYVDRAGRPLIGQVVALGCGLIAYFSCLPGGATQIFDWLLQISALSSFFTWGSICYAHIRFRAAMTHQGQSIKYLPFKACFGVYGSYLGLLINVLCICAQIFLAFSPIYGSLTATSWVMEVVAVPVILAFFAVWKLCTSRKEGGWIRLAEMDLVTGRKDDLVTAHREDAEERATWSPLKRVFRFLC